MESVKKHWNRLPRELIDSSSLEYLKDRGFGSVGLAAGLDDLRRFFQQSYDSMIMCNKPQKFTAEVPKLSHHKTVTGLTISSRRRIILNIWKEQYFLLLVCP